MPALHILRRLERGAQIEVAAARGVADAISCSSKSTLALQSTPGP